MIGFLTIDARVPPASKPRANTKQRHSALDRHKTKVPHEIDAIEWEERNKESRGRQAEEKRTTNDCQKIAFRADQRDRSQPHPDVETVESDEDVVHKQQRCVQQRDEEQKDDLAKGGVKRMVSIETWRSRNGCK